MEHMILRTILEWSAELDIEPLIRVRKNASLKGGGCMPCKFTVMEQLGSDGWKKERVMVTGGWLNQLSHV